MRAPISVRMFDSVIVVGYLTILNDTPRSGSPMWKAWSPWSKSGE